MDQCREDEKNLNSVQQLLESGQMDETGSSRSTLDRVFEGLEEKKTAIFVVVSDTDRSMDMLANLFFTQAMNELCRYADEECEASNNRLPVDVRFILDDFATNVTIGEFPRMIASIRSRGISTMLMIQAEAQLKSQYGADGPTIIGNCDTYDKDYRRDK